MSWFRDIDDRRFGVPGALRWLGWALAAGVLLGCASPGGLGGPDGPTLPGGLSGLGGPTTARCWPSFPYRDGWLGGDAAYSIPLDAERSLWLFGDTFVGEPGQLDRRGASFIHNSIGLSHCGSDGTWAMEYHWSRDSDGVPHAFIDRGRPGAWWWLFDGFLHEGRLYIGLLEVEKSAPSGPLAMPFRFTGVRLARIENHREPPSKWRVETIPLSDVTDVFPAGAMVRDGEYMYLFTFLVGGDARFPRILTRLPLAALDGQEVDLGSELETLMDDGRWRQGLHPESARIVMADDATEMSVRHHPELQRWVAIYNYPTVGPGFPEARPSDRVWVRFAERLAGPWSEPRSLFRVPELAPDFAGGFDPNTACYAAKEHPRFSSRRRLTFTYVCNLFTGKGEDPNGILGRLVENMLLYRPIPVTVSLPTLIRETDASRER